ncbi:MAG: hypothetical protein GY844_19385 [Bradyrhizobium sp.]|nr:hypothetical protein [Bradyrhizobium sp.]
MKGTIVNLPRKSSNNRRVILGSFAAACRIFRSGRLAAQWRPRRQCEALVGAQCIQSVDREHANTDQGQERCNKIHDATFVLAAG